MPSFKSFAFAAYAVILGKSLFAVLSQQPAPSPTSVVAFTEETDSIARRTTQPLINAPSKDDGIGNNILNNWDLTAIIAGNANKAKAAPSAPAKKASPKPKSSSPKKHKPKSPSKPKAKPAAKPAPSPVGSIINAPSEGDGIGNDSGNNAKGFAGIVNNLNGKRGEAPVVGSLIDAPSEGDGIGNDSGNDAKGFAAIVDNLNGLLGKRDAPVARRSMPNRLDRDHCTYCLR